MSDDATAALALLSRMRFACGDNGLRMQDELEQYLIELRRDAERYRWLRNDAGDLDKPYIHGASESDGWLAGETADKAIDSARGVEQ